MQKTFILLSCEHKSRCISMQCILKTMYKICLANAYGINSSTCTAHVVSVSAITEIRFDCLPNISDNNSLSSVPDSYMGRHDSLVDISCRVSVSPIDISKNEICSC
uniref:Uncharacterized protein n=1 Tax=Arion vulgaris TaxID=1028688 RepID=A0A0B6YNY6_9EUPU